MSFLNDVFSEDSNTKPWAIAQGICYRAPLQTEGGVPWVYPLLSTPKGLKPHTPLQYDVDVHVTPESYFWTCVQHNDFGSPVNFAATAVRLLVFFEATRGWTISDLPAPVIYRQQCLEGWLQILGEDGRTTEYVPSLLSAVHGVAGGQITSISELFDALQRNNSIPVAALRRGTQLARKNRALRMDLASVHALCRQIADRLEPDIQSLARALMSAPPTR